MKQLQLALNAVRHDDALARLEHRGQIVPRANLGSHIKIKERRAGGLIFGQCGEGAADSLADCVFFRLITTASMQVSHSAVLLLSQKFGRVAAHAKPAGKY